MGLSTYSIEAQGAKKIRQANVMAEARKLKAENLGIEEIWAVSKR